MTVKAIVTDMDGTFLNDAKQYDRSRFLAQFAQLQQQGISILNFVLYHRQCPEISVRRFPDILPEIQPYQPTMVLISSEASWNYWQQLCGQNPVQAQWVYLVLGERVVKILENTATRTGKTFNIIPLENLSASGMIQRINDWQGNL